MNLIYRRIVYLIFVSAFFIAAPLIIMYTQGYRYNFSKSRVQKTGILIISSLPKKADIYLNGKLLKNQQTPARIEKLLPADYEIKLTKEGYHPWQKKLPVNENSTAFAEDVILWKQSIPLQLAAIGINNWLVSPERQKIAIITGDNQLEILDTVNSQISHPENQLRLTDPELVGWSNTGKKLIIKDQVKERANYYLLNLSANNGAIAKINSRNYLLVKWDQQNDNVIYGLDKSGLWQIDLFAQTERLVIAEPMDDFLPINNEIFILSGSNIIRFDATSDIDAQLESDGYQLIGKENGKIIASNPSRQRLAVLDLEAPAKNFYIDAKNFDWLNSRTLLFFNDWEIWIYNFEDKEPKLITRLGKQIAGALWYKSGQHIIFAAENELRVIELDNRESRNIITLAEVPQIIDLSLDPAGKNIYFAGRYSDQEEILKLNIR